MSLYRTEREGSRSVPLNQANFASPHQGTFGNAWLLQLEVATGIQHMKARDDAKHAKMHRTVPHNKDLPGPSGDNALSRNPDQSKPLLEFFSLAI